MMMVMVIVIWWWWWWSHSSLDSCRERRLGPWRVWIWIHTPEITCSEKIFVLICRKHDNLLACDPRCRPLRGDLERRVAVWIRSDLSRAAVCCDSRCRPVMHVQSSLSCARDSANARDSKERAYISSDKLGNLIWSSRVPRCIHHHRPTTTTTTTSWTTPNVRSQKMAFQSAHKSPESPKMAWTS